MSDWEERPDPSSGKSYYWNRVTNETTWTPPPGFGAPPPPAVSPWTARTDPNTGQTYYWNKDTNETTWTTPAGFAPAPPMYSQPIPQPPSSPPAIASPPPALQRAPSTGAAAMAGAGAMSSSSVNVTVVTNAVAAASSSADLGKQPSSADMARRKTIASKKAADLKKMYEEFDKDVLPELKMIEMSTISLYGFVDFKDEWLETSIVSYLKRILPAVKKIKQQLNLVYKSIFSTPYVSCRVTTAYYGLKKVLTELRLVGLYCGCHSYNGSKSVRNIATSILNELGTIRTNFSLNIDVKGNSSVVGASQSVVDITKNTNANIQDGTAHPEEEEE